MKDVSVIVTAGISTSRKEALSSNAECLEPYHIESPVARVADMDTDPGSGDKSDSRNAVFRAFLNVDLGPCFRKLSEYVFLDLPDY